MFKIKDYNLQSFTIGSKYVRAFSIDSCSGIIVDYVLAECGVESSPFPAEFYNRISSGEGAIKLQNIEDTVSYIVTRDNVTISQRTGSIEDELNDVEITLRQSKHIIPGTLSFLKDPKAKFLGTVWQFTEKHAKARERFKHPVAEDICNKLLKLNLKGGEYPSESGVRLAFRKKLSQGYLMRGQDDFLNIILNIGDIAINDLWPNSEKTKSRTEIIEDTQVGFVSIDIQTYFDPRKRITEKAIDAHWEECKRLGNRIAELLKGIGFETE